MTLPCLQCAGALPNRTPTAMATPSCASMKSIGVWPSLVRSRPLYPRQVLTAAGLFRGHRVCLYIGSKVRLSAVPESDRFNRLCSHRGRARSAAGQLGSGQQCLYCQVIVPTHRTPRARSASVVLTPNLQQTNHRPLRNVVDPAADAEALSLVAAWYEEDANAVPCVHAMRPISTMLPNYGDATKPAEVCMTFDFQDMGPSSAVIDMLRERWLCCD